MSIDSEIKKIVEKNIGINLKSAKDRGRFIKELSKFTHSQIKNKKQVISAEDESETFDVFEKIKSAVSRKKERIEKRKENSLSSHPELNPLHGYVAGQVANMTDDRDIEAFYKDKKAKKPVKPKKVKVQPPSLDEIKDKDIQIPPKPKSTNKKKSGGFGHLRK